MHFLPGETDNKYHLRGKCIPLQTLEGRDDRKVLLQAPNAGFEEAISGAENSSWKKQMFPDYLFLLLGRTRFASAMLLFPEYSVVTAMHWLSPAPQGCELAWQSEHEFRLCLFSANFWLTSSIISFFINAQNAGFLIWWNLLIYSFLKP